MIYPLDGHPETVEAIAKKILPNNDSSLQWAPPRYGLSDNPERTAEMIYSRFVRKSSHAPAEQSRTDPDVWNVFKTPLAQLGIIHKLVPTEIETEMDSLKFNYAYKNWLWHCLEPLSLDLLRPENIKEKARTWYGKLHIVREAKAPFKPYFLVGGPDLQKRINDVDRVSKAYQNALRILKNLPELGVEVFEENQADEFADRLSKIIG